MLYETHLTTDVDSNEVRVRGYKMIRCDSDSKHTGGVVVYINRTMKFYNMKIYKTDFAWVITFQVDNSHDKITIAAVYLSPSENKANIMIFLDLWFGKLCENESVLIEGDFNIDVGADSTYSRLLESEICCDNGIMQLDNNQARVTSIYIDLCITNVYSAKCMVSDDDQITDHKTLQIQMMVKC